MPTGIYLRTKKRTWKLNEETKYEYQVNRLTEKIKLAIITGDRKKYDKVVTVLSNCANSKNTGINKELLVDAFCKIICWAIEKMS